MSRRASASTSVLARIRAWFGMRQKELALYLAVSPVTVHAIEAGRRPLSSPAADALLPLLRQLPEPPAPLDVPFTALPPTSPAPDAGALDFRRRVCLHRAAKLRAEAEPLAARAHYAQRWAAALPDLLPPPEHERAAWLTGWLHRRARPLSADDVTRYHLLQAQIQALETEAAALAAIVSQ